MNPTYFWHNTTILLTPIWRSDQTVELFADAHAPQNAFLVSLHRVRMKGGMCKMVDNAHWNKQGLGSDLDI